MTAQEYILAELEKLKQPIVQEDIGNTPLEEAILRRVLSKKFRKTHADQPTVDTAKTAIKLAVDSGKPVRLMLHFGGNKLWRLDEAPNIEWGELFSLIYYANWAKYIASVYKPGVLFEYMSMDVCVERMNNIPHEQTDHYTEGMLSLLKWAEQFVPGGVTFIYTCYGDLYENREEYYKELEISKQQWLKNNGGELPVLSESNKAATELNVKLKPGQDSDPLWREKVELEHRGIFGTKSFDAYTSDPTAIPHCPTWYSGFIATGSTKRSLAKFWVGVGALERKGGSYNEIILTPKQLEAAKFDWEEVSIEGLKGKNFSKIRVI